MKFAILTFSMFLAVSVMAQSQRRTAGEISYARGVNVNGSGAVSGATLLNGSRIKTGPGGMAIISLGRNGKIELGAESDLLLNCSNESIGGNLVSGKATFSAPSTTDITIATPSGVIASDKPGATTLSVEVRSDSTKYTVLQNKAHLTVGTQMESLLALQQRVVVRDVRGLPVISSRNVVTRAPSASSSTSNVFQATVSQTVLSILNLQPPRTSASFATTSITCKDFFGDIQNIGSSRCIPLSPRN